MSVIHKVAAAATAVAALGALALGAGAAHATTAEGITITAGENMTLGGRAFNAYLIGNYTDIVQANGKVKSFNVVGTAASNTWAKDAIGVSGPVHAPVQGAFHGGGGRHVDRRAVIERVGGVLEPPVFDPGSHACP